MTRSCRTRLPLGAPSQDGRRQARWPVSIFSRRDLRLEAAHVRCRANDLFISSMVTFFPSNTASSLVPARISRLFSGSCRSCCPVKAQTLLTTSPRGSGFEPTTATSFFNICFSAFGFLPEALAATFLPLVDLPGIDVLPAVCFKNPIRHS